jgi:hypothetical protein
MEFIHTMTWLDALKLFGVVVLIKVAWDLGGKVL